MHWSSIPIHIVDFEGTINSGIIEYGIVTIHQETIIQTQSRLCSAIGEISLKEIRQHGITSDMIENKIPFSQDWELFAKLREEGILGAHHAHTENMLLKNTWPFPRMSRDFMNPSGSQATWGPWIDTCQLYKVIYPQINKYKLSHLIEVFQLNDKLEELSLKHCPKSRRKYHCALYDALASATLLLYLMSLKEFKDCTIQWMITYSASLEKQDEMRQMLL